MIDQARREAYDSGAASVRRAMQGKAQPATPPPARTEEPPPTAATPDVLSLMRLRDEFDDATAEVNLTGEQRRALRNQVMSQRPPDVAAFVKSFIDVWRPATTVPATPASNPTTTPQAPHPTAPPASLAQMPGAVPPAATVVTPDTPLAILAKLDPARVDAMAKADPAGFVERLRREARGTQLRLRG